MKLKSKLICIIVSDCCTPALCSWEYTDQAVISWQNQATSKEEIFHWNTEVRHIGLLLGGAVLRQLITAAAPTELVIPREFRLKMSDSWDSLTAIAERKQWCWTWRKEVKRVEYQSSSSYWPNRIKPRPSIGVRYAKSLSIRYQYFVKYGCLTSVEEIGCLGLDGW